MAAEAVWAQLSVNKRHIDLYHAFTQAGLNHWSRQYEYPWAIINGKFVSGEFVLDAGGGNECDLLQYALGDGNCFVVNMDYIESNLPSNRYRNVLRMAGDIRDLPFCEGSFDKVLCISVLEHIPGDPLDCAKELWRVLSPGGRLLVTMDVVDNLITSENGNHYHGLDLAGAKRVLKHFDLDIPSEPTDILTHKAEGSENTTIKVLCFFVDKS